MAVSQKKLNKRWKGDASESRGETYGEIKSKLERRRQDLASQRRLNQTLVKGKPFAFNWIVRDDGDFRVRFKKFSVFDVAGRGYYRIVRHLIEFGRTFASTQASDESAIDETDQV